MCKKLMKKRIIPAIPLTSESLILDIGYNDEPYLMRETMIRYGLKVLLPGHGITMLRQARKYLIGKNKGQGVGREEMYCVEVPELDRLLSSQEVTNDIPSSG